VFDVLHVVVSGRVQGVGFRYAARVEAVGLGLTGWIRNRADGSVEARFEGARNPLEQILAWCRQGPAWASVTGVAHEWSHAENMHETFEIRR